MAAAGNCASTSTLRVAATLILIITLTFPPLLSVYGGSSSSPSPSSSSMSISRSGRGNSSRERVEEIIRKKVGSRPPGCMNKCMNCRPCEATLVIPPHHQAFSPSHREEDDTYYLLFWKCRCGDKLFHP